MILGAVRGVRSGMPGRWGTDRYRWTVTLFGEPEPLAAGRTWELAEARSRAERALLAYIEGVELPSREGRHWLTDHWRSSSGACSTHSTTG